MHSPNHGPENCLHKRNRVYYRPPSTMPILLSETFQVPVVLCEKLHLLYLHTKRVVFLDNLFLNVNVAHVLLNIGIGVMGTTRKSSRGFPKAFQRLSKCFPKALRDIKDLTQAMAYGNTIPTQSGEALCFAW